MSGHAQKAKADLLILQQFHDAVEATPELDLLQSRHVTSITQSDKLSINTVSKLMHLLKHKSTVLDQVQTQCKEMGTLARKTWKLASVLKGIKDLSDQEAAVNAIESAGA